MDSYTQDDVQQILQLAIARQVNDDELSRAQLMEIATDLGISTYELQIAEDEWKTQREENSDRQSYNLYRRVQFRQHLVKYIIVNVFLVLLNVVSAGEVSWSLYVLLAWGLGVSLDGWKIFQVDTEEYEQAFQKWRRQRQLKQTFSSLLDRVLKPNSSNTSKPVITSTTPLKSEITSEQSSEQSTSDR